MSVLNILTVTVVFFMLYAHSSVVTGLSGPNVCPVTLSNQQSAMTTMTRPGTYQYSYRCGRMGWRRCHGTRYKVEYYQAPVYKLVYYREDRCCAGWQLTGSTCSAPICNGGCVHGTCIAPNTCRCLPGWTGSKCTQDINECLTNNGGCAHSCTNTPGSYVCSCNTGWQLQGQHSCVAPGCQSLDILNYPMCAETGTTEKECNERKCCYVPSFKVCVTPRPEDRREDASSGDGDI